MANEYERLLREWVEMAPHWIEEARAGGDLETQGLQIHTHLHPHIPPVSLPRRVYCRRAYAAFDRHFIGVTPDYKIQIRPEPLEEKDGPMLRHGIQEMHNQRLILPIKASQYPDRDLLALRYEEFKKAI